MESNTELEARYNRVKLLVTTARRQVERMKLGSTARTRKAQWAGCLYFTQLQIESELRERGHDV